MSNHADALTWRAVVKNAAGYVKYLTEDNPIVKAFYGVTDLATWATERIEALLGEATMRWAALDESDAAEALGAAGESVEALRQAGFEHLLPESESEPEWVF